MSTKVAQTKKHPIKTERTQVLSEYIWLGVAWHIPFCYHCCFYLNNGGWIVGNELKAQYLRAGSAVRYWLFEWRSRLHPPSWKGSDIKAWWRFRQPSNPSTPLNISTDAPQFPTPARLSSDVELRHQRRKHKHGPDPRSHSQWDSPCNKIWWTVSNFLLRRAKCNHSARCSDAGSPVVFYCTYLVCVRSGNPTKWLCCITAWDTRPNHKHGHMTAWK